MKKLMQEFKDFAFSGNLVTLAVAFILAAAFGSVVTSFVENIITPIIAAIGGKRDFSEVGFDLGDGRVAVGLFLNALLAFVVLAFVLFLIVKAYKSYEAKRRAAGEPPSSPSEEVVLLTEIRDALRNR